MLLSCTRKRENVNRNRIYWLRLTAVLAQIYSFISTGFYACRRFYDIPSSILDESVITDRICLLAMCCKFCCVIKSSCVVYCICQSDSKSNLPKCITPHSTPTTARSLGFMFDEHLTFADQVSSLSKSCHFRIRKSAVSALTSIPKQPPPLPSPSFTPNSITVILFTTIYL